MEAVYRHPEYTRFYRLEAIRDDPHLKPRVDLDWEIQAQILTVDFVHNDNDPTPRIYSPKPERFYIPPQLTEDTFLAWEETEIDPDGPEVEESAAPELPWLVPVEEEEEDSDKEVHNEKEETMSHILEQEPWQEYMPEVPQVRVRKSACFESMGLGGALRYTVEGDKKPSISSSFSSGRLRGKMREVSKRWSSVGQMLWKKLET